MVKGNIFKKYKNTTVTLWTLKLLYQHNEKYEKCEDCRLNFELKNKIYIMKMILNPTRLSI